MRNLLMFFLLFSILSCNQKEKEIILNKLDGTEIKFNEVNKSKFNAYVFLSPECPLSEASLLELKRLDALFAKNNYSTTIIVPGDLFNIEEINKFKNSFKVEFPIYIDKHYELCDTLKASITPEYFLLNENFSVLYSGAIDDRALDNEVIRQSARNRFAENAIQLLINKKPIEVTKTKAVGCYIER